MKSNSSSPARRLLSVLLAALVLLPNLVFAPARAATLQPPQTQIVVDGFVKNQFGDAVPGAQVVLSGNAAGTTTTDSDSEPDSEPDA